MRPGLLWLATVLAGVAVTGCGGGGGSDAEIARDLGSNVSTVQTPTPTSNKATAAGSFSCDRTAGPCDLALSKPGSAPNATTHTNSISIEFNPDGGPATGNLTADLAMSDGNCEFKAQAELTGQFDAVTRFFNGSGTLTVTKTGACDGATARDGSLSWTGSMGSDGKSISGQIKQESAAFPFALTVQ